MLPPNDFPSSSLADLGRSFALNRNQNINHLASWRLHEHEREGVLGGVREVVVHDSFLVVRTAEFSTEHLDIFMIAESPDTRASHVFS